MRVADFTFELPDSLIARHPLAERRNSRLLTLDGESGIFLRGGVLIKHNDTVVGAIGVGGAPGGQLDDNIAFEALKEFSL